MRHDSHYVDQLTERFGESVGRFIAITDLQPNPGQPRQTVGDLNELRASIESKGILEPILVRPKGKGKYQIISGERRFRAAMEAGLTEIPCIELDVPENEVLEIALVENLHRKDLTAFEEAEGYQTLIEKFGYTHQRIAETVGKSRVTITESLSLTAIPPSVREQCRHADIASKSLLLEIARCADEETMLRTIAAIANGAGRGEVRAEKKSQAAGDGRSGRRPFRLNYAPKGSAFRVNLAFNRSRVAKDEVLAALRRLIEEIEAGKVEIRGKTR